MMLHALAWHRSVCADFISGSIFLHARQRTYTTHIHIYDGKKIISWNAAGIIRAPIFAVPLSFHSLSNENGKNYSMYFNTHVPARSTCFLIKRRVRCWMAPGDMNTKVSSTFVCVRVAELGKRRLEILTRTRIYSRRGNQLFEKQKATRINICSRFHNIDFWSHLFVRWKEKEIRDPAVPRGVFKNSTYRKTPLVIKWWMARARLKRPLKQQPSSTHTFTWAAGVSCFIYAYTSPASINWEINLICPAGAYANEPNENNKNIPLPILTATTGERK